MVKITKSQADVALLTHIPRELNTLPMSEVLSDPEHEWHCQKPALPPPQLNCQQRKQHKTEPIPRFRGS